MNCNKDNKGCGCHNDVDMNVCDKNINMLPMLQTYTTKLLKPNMQCGKNVLTQCMMSCENYKYIICWDFDLRGETVTVPKNCILEFDGGSLNNGNLVLDCTALYPMPFDMSKYFKNVNVSGVYKTIVSSGGFEGIREDKFVKGQTIVNNIGIDNWKKTLKYFDGYQLADIPTMPKVSVSPSARENTLNLISDWLHYKENHRYADGSIQDFVYYKDTTNNTCFRRNFDETKQWETNCSTFSMLIALGIPFEKSRYFLGKDADNEFDGNHYANKELMNWFMNSNYTSSRDLAVYLYNQGFCFTPNEDFSNIDTGDIIFFNTNDGNDREGIDFMGIDHSAIFGHKFGDRIVVFEVTGAVRVPEQLDDEGNPIKEGKPVRNEYTTTGALRNIVLCARVPRKEYETDYQNLIYNGNEPRIVGDIEGNVVVPIDKPDTPFVANTYTCTRKLPQDTTYTAIIDGTLLEGSYFGLYKMVVNNHGELVRERALATFSNEFAYRPADNKYYITFTTPEEVQLLGVTVYANAGYSQMMARINSVTLVKGVVTNILNIGNLGFPKNLTITPLVEGITVTDFRVSYSGDIISVAGTFTGAEIDTNRFISLFKIEPLYYIQTLSFGLGGVGYDTNEKNIICQATRTSSGYGVIRFKSDVAVNTTDNVHFSVTIPSR